MEHPASQPQERWLPIPGWNGYYSVSDMGRVRSETRIVYDSLAQAKPIRGRIIRPELLKSGYLQLNLNYNGVRNARRVHHLVLETFVGPRPEGFEACHNNGRRCDNRLTNLRWDTPSENRLDAVRHGTQYPARKKRCPRGHLLVIPNLTGYSVKSGFRACLSCRRAYNRADLSWRRKRIRLDWIPISHDIYADMQVESEDAS